MVAHPATKFLSDTDYFVPDAIKEREECLAEFFVERPYDYAMLLTLFGVWNDQFTDGTCKHIPSGSRSLGPLRAYRLMLLC